MREKRLIMYTVYIFDMIKKCATTNEGIVLSASDKM